MSDACPDAAQGAAARPAPLDWQAPWLRAWRGIEPALGLPLAVLADAPASRRLAVLDAAAARCGAVCADGHALRFVADVPPDGMAYESMVASSGRVPTRVDGAGGLHDLLGALAWLRFPRTKRVLNALQRDAIRIEGVGGRRGPVRDGITLFDENGVVLAVADAADGARLRAHDWHGLLVAGRARWRDGGCGPRRHAEVDAGTAVVPGGDPACRAAATLEAVPFGHGLLEKLAQPRPAITAHVRVVRMPAAWFALGEGERWERLDRALAARFAARAPRPSAFSPLPVLGVPGWWGANRDPAFYDDATVFRPRRIRAWSNPWSAGAPVGGYNSRRDADQAIAVAARLRPAAGEEGPDSAGQGAG